MTSSHSSSPHVTSQPTTLLHLTPQATSWHQNRSRYHRGTAESLCTAKKWFGHGAGRSPCAHSIGKFFLCYILFFLLKLPPPACPGTTCKYQTKRPRISNFFHVFFCWKRWSKRNLNAGNPSNAGRRTATFSKSPSETHGKQGLLGGWRRGAVKKIAISIDAGFRYAQFFLPPMSCCLNTFSFEQLFFCRICIRTVFFSKLNFLRLTYHLNLWLEDYFPVGEAYFQRLCYWEPFHVRTDRISCQGGCAIRKRYIPAIPLSSLSLNLRNTYTGTAIVRVHHSAFALYAATYLGNMSS